MLSDIYMNPTIAVSFMSRGAAPPKTSLPIIPVASGMLSETEASISCPCLRLFDSSVWSNVVFFSYTQTLIATRTETAPR